MEGDEESSITGDRMQPLLGKGEGVGRALLGRGEGVGMVVLSGAILVITGEMGIRGIEL